MKGIRLSAARLQFHQIFRIILHAPKHYRVWLRESSKYPSDPKIAAKERDRLAKDPNAIAKGDVAAFEINKHDYTDLMAFLQAKTGIAVQREEAKR
ncbi:MAG: hypothetical protein ACRD3D_13955 [Terriglobia bacterium]